MKKLRYIIILFATALALVQTGCVKENLRPEMPDNALEDQWAVRNGDEVTFKVGLGIPRDNYSETKLLDGAPHVRFLYVAVFGEGDVLAQKVVKAQAGTHTEPSDNFIANSSDHYLTYFHVSLRYVPTGTRYVQYIATSQEIPELESASYEDEVTFVKRLLVHDGADAYWGRKTFDEGISEETDMSFIPMIRNYCRVSVSFSGDASKFRLKTFKVFNVPKYGTIAPYNDEKPVAYHYQLDPEGHIIYYRPDGSVATGPDDPDGAPKLVPDFDTYANYEALYSGGNSYTGTALEDAYERLTSPISTTFDEGATAGQQYRGYMPGASYQSYKSNFVEGDFLNVEGGQVKYDYLYEVEHSESNNNPFIIFKGAYSDDDGSSWTDYYYKADIVYTDPVSLEKKFYHVLRNFQYNLVITDVLSPGSNSISEAVNSIAMNNFEASTMSSMLTNIDDGQKQLFLSTTDIFVTKGETSLTIYAKSIKNTGGVLSNDNANINYIPLAEGDYIGGEIVRHDDTRITISDVTDTSDPYYTTEVLDKWKKIVITLNGDQSDIVSGVVWRQPITFTNKETVGNVVKGVTRTLNISMREKMLLTVSCPDFVQDANTSFYVDFSIPAALSQARFPLYFDFEFQNSTLYPDASNASYPQLTTITGKSQIEGQTNKNTYYFRRTITWDEYVSVQADNMAIKTFRTYFKTLQAASATTVWVFPGKENDWYTYYRNEAYTNCASFINNALPGLVYFRYGHLYLTAGSSGSVPIVSNSPGEITYSSGTTSVATVNSSTGAVRVSSEATVGQTSVITATLAAGGKYAGGATATYTVHVVASAPEIGLRMAQEPQWVVAVGEDVTNPVTGATSFTSSPAGVVSVNSSGVVHGQTVGTAIVTAVGVDGSGNAQTTNYAITVVDGKAPNGTLYHNETFVDSEYQLGDYTITDITNESSYEHVWYWYGAKGATASAYSEDAPHASESYLTSKERDLTTATKPVLIFDHSGNFFGSHANVLSSCSVQISDDDGASWSTITMSEYPSGVDWNVVTASANLSDYAGKKIKLRFRYVSNNEYAGSWQIRNLRIVEYRAS